MKLSDDKIGELSHRITEELSADERVVFNATYNRIRRAVQTSFSKAMQKDAQIERTVTSKIHSLKRNVDEGSSEWEALYWQYYEDEVHKLRSLR